METLILGRGRWILRSWMLLPKEKFPRLSRFLVPPTHRRSVLLTSEEEYARWLNPEVVERGLREELMRPFPDGKLAYESLPPTTHKRPSDEDAHAD